MEIKLERIVAELKQGNNEVLSEVFQKHGAYCINLLLKKTSCSKEDAEDILVEAVLSFREKILTGKIEYLTNIRNYLYGTCKNMWLHRYRHLKTKTEKEPEILQYFYDECSELLDIENASEPNSELLKLTRVGLEQLKDKCKRIIELFYIREYSMTQIAEEMSFSSPDVAKTTKSRCFAKLMESVKSLQLESFSL